MKGECWVCGGRFVENGGALHCEVHHVIPQAYGGTDGPTVELCDTHHTALHKIALRLRSKKGYRHLLGTDDLEQVKKLLWLATRVNIAWKAVRDDPNRKVALSIVLNSEDAEKLEQLQVIYQKKGKNAIFTLALDTLYRKHFLR